MQNFKKGKRISEGAFGTVYEAEVISMPEGKDYPKKVAIKQVYTSSQNL
jgi:serine/threonine protein kinase